MPAPRNSTADDPRIVALAAANAANPWQPELSLAARWRADAEGRDAIPRCWRAWGYEPVAALMAAYRGTQVDPGTLRHYWRDDLRKGRSRLLPPPDAVIRRGPKGELLPGWADETILAWLAAKPDFPYHEDSFSTWRDNSPEVDPRLVELIVGNEQENGRAFNDVVNPGLFDAPDAYLTLGYEAAARLMTEAQGTSVSNTTVRHYWGTDLKRVHPKTGERIPYSRRMPIPDVVIGRGANAELLPGWTRQTILDWLPTREGPGNHTRGEDRRGYDEGRTGMTKVGGVWVSTRTPVPV